MKAATQSSAPESSGNGAPARVETPADPETPGARPLLGFLRRPTFSTSPPARLTTWHWLGWMSLLLLAAYVSSAFTHILAHAFGWPVPASSARVRFLIQPSRAAVPVVLVAPALEELGFRAFLSTAPRFVFLGLAFFIGYAYLVIQANLTPTAATIPPLEMLTHYFYAFWVFLPAGAISLLLYRYRRAAVLAFFRSRAGWVFWASCILFGAAHASLYTNHLVWWGFALALPQFLLGVGLAYLRVNFGLRWSIASHYAIDVPSVFGSWLYLSAAPGSLLHRGMLAALTAIGLGLVAYGLLVLWRVSRHAW